MDKERRTQSSSSIQLSDKEISDRVSQALLLLKRKGKWWARQYKIVADPLIELKEYQPWKVANIKKDIMEEIEVAFYDNALFSHFLKLVDHAEAELAKNIREDNNYLEYLEGKLNLFQRDAYRYARKKTIQNITYKLKERNLQPEERRFIYGMKSYLEWLEWASNQTIQNRVKSEEWFSPFNDYLPYDYLQPKVRVTKLWVIPVKEFMSVVAEKQTDMLLKYYKQGEISANKIQIYITHGLNDLWGGIRPYKTNLSRHPEFADLTQKLQDEQEKIRHITTFKVRFMNAREAYERNKEDIWQVMYFAFKTYTVLQQAKKYNIDYTTLGIRKELIEHFEEHKNFWHSLYEEVGKAREWFTGKKKHEKIKKLCLRIFREDEKSNELSDNINLIMS